MSAGSTITTFAVAIYIGLALNQFFSSITKDLFAPFIAALFPTAQQTITSFTIQVGSIKINIGDAIGATFNLFIAYLVVSLTLPYIREYAPLGGRKH
jgi:large-conductance mechanosensitive channel